MVSMLALKVFYAKIDMRGPYETSPQKQLEETETIEKVLERVNK